MRRSRPRARLCCPLSVLRVALLLSLTRPQDRVQALDWPAIEAWGKLHAQALHDFQRKHKVLLTLEDVGNGDECATSMSDAANGQFLMFKYDGNKRNHVSQNEQGEHITLFLSYVGNHLNDIYCIQSGVTGLQPFAEHLALTLDDDTMVKLHLAQQDSAWMTDSLKHGLFKRLIDDPACPLGNRPMVRSTVAISSWCRGRWCGRRSAAAPPPHPLSLPSQVFMLDGHGSNLTQEMSDLAAENKILLGITPAHLTSRCQQHDLYDGPIHRAKKRIGELLDRQFQAHRRQPENQGKRVFLKKAEIYACIQKAVSDTAREGLAAPVPKNIRDNKRVGYVMKGTCAGSPRPSFPHGGPSPQARSRAQ